MTSVQAVATVLIPGAFADYLEGTSDLTDEPHPDSAELRRAWDAGVRHTRGRSYTLALTTGRHQLELVLDHAELVASQSARDGEWRPAELQGARLAVVRVKQALSTLTAS